MFNDSYILLFQLNVDNIHIFCFRSHKEIVMPRLGASNFSVVIENGGNGTEEAFSDFRARISKNIIAGKASTSGQTGSSTSSSVLPASVHSSSVPPSTSAVDPSMHFKAEMMGWNNFPIQHSQFQMPPNNFPGLQHAPQMPSFPPYDLPVLSQMPFHLPNESTGQFSVPVNRNLQNAAQTFSRNNCVMPPGGPINIAPDCLKQEIKVEPDESGQHQHSPMDLSPHRLVKHIAVKW